MKKYWVSCTKFTVQVNVDDTGKIVWAAPIVRQFVGQPFANLERWIDKWRPRIEILKDGSET